MSVYFYMIIALSFGAIFYDGLVSNRGHYESHKVRRYGYTVFFVFCCLIIIFIAGLRGNMAVDMPAYASEYKHIASMSFGEIFNNGFRLQGRNSTEIGFVLLNKLFSLLGFNSAQFFFIMSLLSFLPFFIIVNKNSEMQFLSLLFFVCLGYFFHSFNVIRSCFVSGLLCLCVDDIIEGRFKPYLIKILILFTFHSASIMLIPLYFIGKKSLVKSRKSILFIAIGTFVISRMSTIFAFFDRIFFDSFYTTVYIGNTLNRISFNATIPYAAILIIVFFAEFTNKEESTKTEITIANGTLIWSILGLLRLQMDVFSRYQDMICIFPAIYIPCILYRCFNHKNGNNNIVIRIILIVAITLFLVLWFHKIINDSPYNPYYTFWQ